MKIREFVEKYNNMATENLKDRFVKDNIKITSYIPFLKKDALANILIDATMYQYKTYTDEDGVVERQKTDIIHINSVVQYIFFCRAVIENYTDLEIETKEFCEEYDLLKSSGLLDKLMVGTEQTAPIIPADEISELRQIISLKQADIVTNFSNPQTYIQNQVTRFAEIAGVTLKPAIDKLVGAIQDMDDKDIEKIGNKIEKVLKKIK